MVCPFCENTYSKREWLSGGGKWIAENPEAPVRGFHVTTIDAPTLSWAELSDEWAEANRRAKSGDYAALKTFINTRLAETWEQPGEVVEGHALEARREIYGEGLPDGVCILTMGVDVQDDRLAYEVVGWGLGFESWGIEYGELWGSPRQGDVWNRLDDILARSWFWRNGKALRISTTAVDTGGHMSTQVYTYCKAREPRRVYAVKGQAGDKLPMTRPGKAGMNARLFMVGVDGIKQDIITWLKRGNHGEGYCHFPIGEGGEIINGYDTAYFDMLTAEKRVLTQNKRGFNVYTWEKPAGRRNEAFDCRVYARAALRIMSNRDDQLLKRQHALAGWVAPVLKGAKKSVPSMAGGKPKTKNSSNRNIQAASRAVTL
jgi:phage terminase large subunit GpA-like protein